MFSIKNTFVHVIEDGEWSPLPQRRQRALTWRASSLSACSTSESSSTSVGSEDHDLPSSATSVGYAFAVTIGGKDHDSPGLSGSPSLSEFQQPEAAWGPAAASRSVGFRDRSRRIHFEGIGALESLRQTQVAEIQEALSIARALRGRVVEATESMTGHTILEDLIFALPMNEFIFIAEELAGEGSRLASTAWGHGVVCRLLEFANDHPATARLIDEILAHDPASMFCHKFGHLVSVSILSNGLPHQQARVLDVLRSDVWRFGRHRFASRVVKEALDGDATGCDRLVAALLHAAPLMKLACHFFGVDVVRVLLARPAARKQAAKLLRPMSHRLCRDKFGASILSELDSDSSVADHLLAPLLKAGA